MGSIRENKKREKKNEEEMEREKKLKKRETKRSYNIAKAYYYTSHQSEKY